MWYGQCSASEQKRYTTATAHTKKNWREKKYTTIKLLNRLWPVLNASAQLRRKTATMTTKRQQQQQQPTPDQCEYVLRLRSHNINIVLHIWYGAKPMPNWTRLANWKQQTYLESNCSLIVPMRCWTLEIDARSPVVRCWKSCVAWSRHIIYYHGFSRYAHPACGCLLEIARINFCICQNGIQSPISYTGFYFSVRCALFFFTDIRL